MQVETIVNGGVSLVLIPQNTMEEELLKQLMRQTNEITEIRAGATVLNRTINNGILISGKVVAETIPDPEVDPIPDVPTLGTLHSPEDEDQS